LLFSYSFGCAYSIFQGHATRQFGKGVVLAKLSHYAVEFDTAVSRENNRNIKLEYVSNPDALIELESKWENQEQSPQPIDELFEFVKQFGANLPLSGQKKMYV
jgi:hypothetical protein